MVFSAHTQRQSQHRMSVDPSTFESVVPSRFITFTFPNPSPSDRHLLHTSLIRVAVLDSPSSTHPHKIAAMLVPLHRESDWTFSTEAGHLQLLLSTTPPLSRLILIGNLPISSQPTSYDCSLPPIHNDSIIHSNVEEKLAPLLFALLPKCACRQKARLAQIPFLSYEDDVIRSIVVERCFGSCVGEMLIEDVQLETGIDSGECNKEFRRRLRFKRMPNLIQTQMLLHPNMLGFRDLKEVQFRVDKGVLVHPYFTPMVAGLSLISSHLDNRIQSGFRPKALCLGVGGGALLSFLDVQLGFDVLGVEADEVVLRVAKQYFSLVDSASVTVHIGDGIDFIKKIAYVEGQQNVNSSGSCDVENSCWSGDDKFNAKFDVVMIDLDSADAVMGISAPPLEFSSKSVLLAAKSVIGELGILVINVIPPSKSFYETLKHVFSEVFLELYEIDVGNGENYVLVATASPIESASGNSENSFLSKFKGIISGAYMNSVRKVIFDGHERKLRFNC